MVRRQSPGDRSPIGGGAPATPVARRRDWGFCALVAMLFFSSSGAFGAMPADGNAPAAPSVTWYTGSFFGRCDGECAVSLFGGWQVLTPMRDIFVENPSLPWEWHWGKAQLVGAAVSRRLLTLWHALNIEPEAGLARRFGSMHTDEAWLALYFRWTRFPWNRYLYTTIAISTGPSFAVDLPIGSHSAHLLNYFSPELTFALPTQPRYALLVQYHHRSHMWIGSVRDPGWQYLTIGLRYHF